MELTHFETVIKLFRSMDDPRQAGKVQYPLPEILLLVLCAAICRSCSHEILAHNKIYRI